jgi:hypothetical protein
VRGVWRLLASSSRGDGDVPLCARSTALGYRAKSIGLAAARTTKDATTAELMPAGYRKIPEEG